MTTPITFHELQRQAHGIARSYKAAGYDMTLRQLYYQLVAQGLIDNSQKSYKRVGSACVKARLEGWFEMDLLVDRSRRVGLTDAATFEADIDDCEDRAASYVYAIPDWVVTASKWWGQPKHVSVWVEKEALAGVFQRPCRALGVGLFPCKGYPSISALWQWLQDLQSSHLANVSQGGGFEEVVVLYFGDHDPDGWQIPRSAEETIHQLMAGHPGLDVPRIRFERVALNMPQVLEHDPPPFAAKMTSSRYAGYISEHGTDDAWELDALNPATLDSLIRDSVGELFDGELHNNTLALLHLVRADLRERMASPGWFSG